MLVRGRDTGLAFGIQAGPGADWESGSSLSLSLSLSRLGTQGTVTAAVAGRDCLSEKLAGPE